MKISLAQQIEEIVREISLRNRVYPHQVATGKMRQAVADYHIERMAAARQTLEWLQENEAKIKAALSAEGGGVTERRPRNFSKDAKIAALASIVFEIPHEHQKIMHEDHVQSLLDWHHNTPYANGGSNHFSNAVPMLRAAHKERTAKVDVPQIAKGKRLRSSEIVRRYKEIQKYEGAAAAAALYPAVERLLQRRKRKIANRPFAKQHRPLQSRNTLRRRT